MFKTHKRQGITLVEVLVIVFIVALLLCLLIPAVMSVREAARRASCIGTIQMIGIGLHNYHDANGCFPPSMLERPAGHLLSVAGPVPGTDNTNGNGADFGWRVLMLPYLFEDTWYQMLDIEHGFPFDGNPDRKTAISLRPGSRSSNIVGPMLLCPSYTGPDWSTASEYPAKSAAIGNYVALGATHLASLYRTETQPIGGTSHPNGTIYPGSKTSIDDITDGTSNTFLVCETREQNYAAWIDGTTAAVVGLAEQTRPSFEIRKDEIFYSPTKDVRTTINWENDNLNAGKFYLPAASHSGSMPWVHGPSSFHPGLVNHGMADGSVQSISEDIDPRTYMHMITRAGSESVNEFFAD